MSDWRELDVKWPKVVCPHCEASGGCIAENTTNKVREYLEFHCFSCKQDFTVPQEDYKVEVLGYKDSVQA